jgi:hypothetical protein
MFAGGLPSVPPDDLSELGNLQLHASYLLDQDQVREKHREAQQQPAGLGQAADGRISSFDTDRMKLATTLAATGHRTVARFSFHRKASPNKFYSRGRAGARRRRRHVVAITLSTV